MILSSISLKNFRSHTDTSLDFSEGLNYIIGGNGEGKTSVLEAVYFLCTTKSSSSKTDGEAVQFNKDSFEIFGSFNNRVSDNVKVIFSRTENKKYYLLNNKLVNRATGIIGKFPVVLLSPSDHAITLGSPGERRKFVDSVISQSSTTYLNFLIDYNRTLKNRSSLLGLLKDKRNLIDKNELDAWTEKLMTTGIQIIFYRKKFLDEFNSFINESYYRIMNEAEIPSVIYNTVNGSHGEDVEVNFREELERLKEEEMRRGTNLSGPHRDDFIFNINNMNLRTFGSQGQNKTFQAVLRFAEFFYLKEVTGRTPLFLLDDVFGELDARRSARISEYLKDVGQAFITLTDFADFSFLHRTEYDKVINLKNGIASYA